MRLTTQLRAEVEATRMRVVLLTRDVLHLGLECQRRDPELTDVIVYPEYKQKFDAIIEELNIYKVRLENILCETDLKEQDHLPMLYRLYKL